MYTSENHILFEAEYMQFKRAGRGHSSQAAELVSLSNLTSARQCQAT